MPIPSTRGIALPTLQFYKCLYTFTSARKIHTEPFKFWTRHYKDKTHNIMIIKNFVVINYSHAISSKLELTHFITEDHRRPRSAELPYKLLNRMDSTTVGSVANFFMISFRPQIWQDEGNPRWQLRCRKNFILTKWNHGKKQPTSLRNKSCGSKEWPVLRNSKKLIRYTPRANQLTAVSSFRFNQGGTLSKGSGTWK